MPDIVKSYSGKLCVLEFRLTFAVAVSDDEGDVAISLMGDEDLQSDRIQRLAELKRKRATLTKTAPSASKKAMKETRALNIADDTGSDVEDNFGFWS